MVTTSQAVFDAVAEIMASPWEWGRADCCTAACDVFAQLHGFDPMAVARGRYRTEAGAYRYIMRRGGFEAAVAGILEAQGFMRSGVSTPGSLALCDQPGPFGAALAICIQPGEYAAKTETGHAILTKTKAVWLCPEH